MKGIVSSFIIIGTYLIVTTTVSNGIKCSGAWSNHACFGGNGKRSHDLEKLLLNRLNTKRSGTINIRGSAVHNQHDDEEHLMRNERGRPRQNKNQALADQDDAWGRPINSNDDAYYESYYDTPWKRVIQRMRPSVFEKKHDGILRNMAHQVKDERDSDEDQLHPSQD